jgi:hypothetical protein
MPYLITPADLAAFQRCRRQWDLGARARQNLEPVGRPHGPDLGQAIREALDIYYFPGMWDWQRQITLPLVLQGFERALASQREQASGEAGDPAWRQPLETGRRLLERYFDWAPGVDRFSPVLVEAEYDVTVLDVTVLDPARPELGLLTPGGEAIRYRGRIDMLAVDANDAYWIVSHRTVDGDWPPAEDLASDEEAVAACWAWEQFYLGMTITGTVFNELRPTVPARPAEPARPGEPARPDRPPRARGLGPWWRRRDDQPQRVRQHEPSGGGRSIPQHRRMYAVAREPAQPERIEQQVTPQFRRTWVRRGPAEIAAAGRRLAEVAAQMTARGVTVRPNPSSEICPPCAFLSPCQAMRAGRDGAALLRAGYRGRGDDKLAEGRLGGGAWSTGRGAAPPRFGGSP